MQDQGNVNGPDPIEDSEALKSYCCRMISVVHRHKHPDASEEMERRRKSKRDKHSNLRGGKKREFISRNKQKEGRESERLGRENGCFHTEHMVEERRRKRERTLQLPEDSTCQPVPIQLISVLKLKSFTEEMRRAAETEIHNPSECGECVRQQATLALDTFIRRKRTQLDSLTLEDRLQTHLCNRDAICLLGELLQTLPKLSDAPNRIWDELQAKEKGIKPSRGYLDNIKRTLQ